MQRMPLIPILAALIAGGAQGRSEVPATREQQVERFVAASSRQDVDEMVYLVSDDVEWLSVDDGAVTVAAHGKPALRARMARQFASCPGCRTTLTGVTATTDRVAAVESVAGSDTGPRAQRRMVVYEFAGPLIRRVYHFPVERPAP